MENKKSFKIKSLDLNNTSELIERVELKNDTAFASVKDKTSELVKTAKKSGRPSNDIKRSPTLYSLQPKIKKFIEVHSLKDGYRHNNEYLEYIIEFYAKHMNYEIKSSDELIR